MKKIKNWLSFNEGKQLDLFKGSSFAKPELEFMGGMSAISQEKLLDYLIDFEDNKYHCDIYVGYADRNSNTGELTSFTFKLPSETDKPYICSRKATPVVCISISYSNPDILGEENLTDSLKDFLNRVSNMYPNYFMKFGGDINGNWDEVTLEELSIDKGFLRKDSGEYYLVSEKTLDIILLWHEEITYSDYEIFKNNGWLGQNVTFKNNKAIIKMDAESLCYNCLLRDDRDEYQNFIISENYDNDYDFYLYDGEQVLDALSQENIARLILDCVNENNFEDSPFAGQYESLQQLLYAAKENSILNLIPRSWNGNSSYARFFKEQSGVFYEIRHLYSEFKSDALQDEQIKELKKTFVSQVEEVLNTKVEIGPFEEIHKKDQRTFFVEFNIDWLENAVSEDQQGESLEFILSEWVETIEIPRLRFYPPEYASIDDEEFNSEVAGFFPK